MEVKWQPGAAAADSRRPPTRPTTNAKTTTTTFLRGCGAMVFVFGADSRVTDALIDVYYILINGAIFHARVLCVRAAAQKLA